MNILHVLHLRGSLQSHKPSLRMSAQCWSLPHLLYLFLSGTFAWVPPITPCPLMSPCDKVLIPPASLLWQSSLDFKDETESSCSTKALYGGNINEVTLISLQWPLGPSLLFIGNIKFVCNVLCPRPHPHYLLSFSPYPCSLLVLTSSLLASGHSFPIYFVDPTQVVAVSICS